MTPPSPPSPYDPLGLIGKLVDEKYRVERLVGEGGFGVVYRAEHALWKRPVALKCFRILAHITDEARQRLVDDFIREGAILSELSARSVAIVQARDVGTLTTDAGEKVPYMALEWLEGESLAELLYRQRQGAGGAPVPWGLGAALGTLEPVARALALAHRRGIAHRDVKPGNIFLLRDEGGGEGPHVKLLDFGIAKVVQAMAEQGFTKTAEGPASFTPSYGAPEQFDRKLGPTGPWTDVFALALVFVELVAGREALEGDDTYQLGFAATNRASRPTPRSLGVEVTDAFEAVFLKALAVQPRERYASAGEFWSALAGALPPSMPRDEAFWASMLDAPTDGYGTVDPFAPTGRRGLSGPRASGPGITGGRSTTSGTALMTVPGAPIGAGEAPKGRGKGLVPALVAGGALVAFAVAGVLIQGARTKGDDAAGASAGSAVMGQPMAAAPSAKVGPVAAPPSSASVVACPPEMARLPGGEFSMGAEGGEEVELPVHQVTLGAYCLDKREVTLREYKRCASLGNCARPPAEVAWEGITPAEKKAFSPLCNASDPEKRKEHPINCVDWDMAAAYCAFVGKRLPTEAEYEFAARGPKGQAYPWGDEMPTAEHMNGCGEGCVRWLKKQKMYTSGAPLYDVDDKFVGTAPVGSFPKGRSPYGLDDLAGNVWEWTADWSGPYAATPQVDPKGPAKGTRRMLRGGGFNSEQAKWLRPSQRWSDSPSARSHVYGVRCALSPGEAAPGAGGAGP
jgi:eukaryotic-like serine/threonine-protein kinase